MSQSNPLKALIQRLTSTPVEELPSIAHFLASSISRNLVTPPAPTVDRTALLHKLKARVSSLLQDRTPEGRFTAVVVAKAVIEAGGREVLVDSEPWIRGLLGILNKSDPAATKKLAILTVSRAFVLTQGFPSIVREVTLPLLPSFNTACLAAIRPRTTKTDKGTQTILSPLLPTALQCWAELLPRHPATFRPFVTRFRPICLSLLSDCATPANTCEYAGALLVALHHSAPQKSAASEWSQLCQDTLRAAHATANHLFRSIREEWTPAESGDPQNPESSRLDRELPSGGPDVLGLAEWRGVHNGAQRLIRLLGLITVSMSASTAAEVPVPLGGILDLCARVLSLTIPGAGKDSPYVVKSNPEFGRDEREMLWTALPTVHVNCLRLLCLTVDVLRHAILPVSQSILDQLTWLFGAEQHLPDVRASSYELLSTLLPRIGATTTDTDVKGMSDIIRFACKDLLRSVEDAGSTVRDEKGSKSTVINADSFAGPTKAWYGQAISEDRSAVYMEAERLILTFLQHVPAHLIPNNLRTDVDRTAILTQQAQALLASVLNPATAQQGQHAPASLLPFFAQTGASLEMEAFLRPRMPAITDKQSSGMALDTAESETRVTLASPTAAVDDSALNRLEEAREVPTADEVVEVLPANGIEAVKAASETLSANDEMASTTVKRDFAVMNGDGLKDWHTTNPGTLPNADAGTKKARIDVGSSASPSRAEGNSEQGLSNGHSGVDTGMIQPASVQNEQHEYGSHTRPWTGVEAQPTIKSVGKFTGPALNADDSDSDIPEINVDPDTSDDDEDMYG